MFQRCRISSRLVRIGVGVRSLNEGLTGNPLRSTSRTHHEAHPHRHRRPRGQTTATVTHANGGTSTRDTRRTATGSTTTLTGPQGTISVTR